MSDISVGTKDATGTEIVLKTIFGREDAPFNDPILDEVYRLTHDEYIRMGYIEPRSDGRLRHYIHLDRIPETSIIVAFVDGRIVGTNSWTKDGVYGLHVDQDFKAECDQIRRELYLRGKALAASWRIVTDNDFNSIRMKIVLTLIAETLKQIVLAGYETAVFTFNPPCFRYSVTIFIVIPV